MHIICPECHTEYSFKDTFLRNPSVKVRCIKCKTVWHPETELPEETNKWLMEQAVGAVKEATEETSLAEEVVYGVPFTEETPAGLESFPFAQDDANEEKVTAEPQEEVSAEDVFSLHDSDTDSDDMPMPESVMNFSLDSSDSLSERKNFSLKTSAKKIVIAVFVLSICAGLWFGRFSLVSTFPFLGSVYGIVGVEAEIPGFGLDFQDVSQQMIVEDGVDMLEISGKVFNRTEKELSLPPLKVGLLDVSGQEIQEQTETLSAQKIAPQMTIPFVIRLASPSAVASKVEITFVKEEKQ
ncbi:MAG: zinc-ribbon domain-containing protein [Alphaproteobacteria bacterium]|nr:zinc-ribbon domain-containing protein [Alphaproteobacteria bacterium]